MVMAMAEMLGGCLSEVTYRWESVCICRGNRANEGDPTIAGYNLASRRNFLDSFLFSSPDQKVNTKMPRPPLVSYGVELPDLNEISFGEEHP